ncbi:outer membrane protein assembly factor BamB family protein [Nocardia suismassiliense]|uniref:outer membrane protein assembly factor BamB family protein n=1 Tax=Nocardia suismassiliense TaxID=2077092 RepID=UPI00131EFB11|nr:PQQ-binding-like beta-propeller repeat protein [Nocardia suismassiliense]
MGWVQPIVRDGKQIRPFGMLGVWAITFVAGAVIMMFVSAIVDWVLLADFERSWRQPGGPRTEWQSYTWAGIISAILQLGAGVTVITWLWRARRNAETMCAARHRRSIGWVIGGWFCPVVNIWFPHTIMSDVWRTSDPRTPPDALDLRGRRAGGWVTAWWLFLLIGWALGFVTLVLGLPATRVETTGDYVIYGFAPVGGFGLIAVEFIRAGVLAVAAFCLGAVISQVQRWQHARAAQQPNALGERPQPPPISLPTGASAEASVADPATPSGPRTLPLRASDPSTIGPYALIGRLGSDARGDTYLGSAPRTGNVVIQTVHVDRGTNISERTELARVFAAARTVHSDFTPAVLDADPEAPQPWIATEYITGPSLRELATEHGPLPLPAVEDVAIGITHALIATHGAGLTHGAITPESVIIAGTGPRVIDFGLSTPHSAPSAFTSPEQLAGEPGGPASDVFSTGAVLSYALIGRPPFGDTDAATLLHRVTTQQPDLTGIPETRLRFVITGCLARHPDARLTTAQILRQLEATSIFEQATAPSFQAPVALPTDVSGVLPNSLRPRSVPISLGRRTVLTKGLIGLGAGALVGGGYAAVKLLAAEDETPKAQPEPRPGQILWQSKIRPHTNSAGSPPIVADGRVYMCGQDNRLHALDAATGAVRWSAEIGSKLSGRHSQVLALADRTIVVDGERSLIGFDATTGARRWATGAADGTYSLCATNDPPYVYAEGPLPGFKVVALDAESGTPRWTTPTDSGTPGSMYFTAGNGVIAAVQGDSLFVLDAVSGAIRWRATVGDRSDYDPLARPSIAADTVVVSKLQQPQIQVFDLASGEPLWTLGGRSEFGADPGQYAVPEGNAIVLGGAPEEYGGGGAPSTLLESLDRRTGTKRWSNSSGKGHLGAPFAADGTVFAVWKSQVHAFDAATGTLRWECHIGAALDGTALDETRWERDPAAARSSVAVADKRAYGYGGHGVYAIQV